MLHYAWETGLSSNHVGLYPPLDSFTFCSDAADLFQAFEEQAKVLKEMNEKIAALEMSLSAKDMELHVEVGTNYFSFRVAVCTWKRYLACVAGISGEEKGECVIYVTDYYQRLTLESWFTNLEQTPLNRCQQLPVPYKRLIDDTKTDRQ